MFRIRVHASDQTTCHHHVCTRGRPYGWIILCANGGGCAPPNPPAFLKAMDACKSKQESGRRHHRCMRQRTSIRSSPCGSCMFARGESYAGHFARLVWTRPPGSELQGLQPPNLAPTCSRKVHLFRIGGTQSGRHVKKIRHLVPHPNSNLSLVQFRHVHLVQSSEASSKAQSQ